MASFLLGVCHRDESRNQENRMPWVNRGREKFDGTSNWQKILNLLAILAIVVLFLAMSAYRTSLDTMQANVLSLRADMQQMTQDDDRVPRPVAVAGNVDTDGLRQSIDDIGEQVLDFDEKLEALASKSVDVRSMTLLREELINTKRRMLRIETGLQELASAPGAPSDRPEDGVSSEDVAAALSTAREALDEVRAFKAMLGYGDM